MCVVSFRFTAPRLPFCTPTSEVGRFGVHMIRFTPKVHLVGVLWVGSILKFL